MRYPVTFKQTDLDSLINNWIFAKIGENPDVYTHDDIPGIYNGTKTFRFS